MHYDQKFLYDFFLKFQKEIGSGGIEVTESDLLEAWREARAETGYFLNDESEEVEDE